jgi:hypothetical protein
MTNNQEDLSADLLAALIEADRELAQANHRIALLEETVRITERELLRVKAEKEELTFAMQSACLTVDGLTQETQDAVSDTLVDPC